jgi:hypothetical protein
MIKSVVTEKKIHNDEVEAHSTVEVKGEFQDIRTELLGILNCIKDECPEMLVSVLREFEQSF